MFLTVLNLICKLKDTVLKYSCNLSNIRQSKDIGKYLIHKNHASELKEK